MENNQRPLALLCCSSGWGGLEMNVLRLAEWLTETFSVTLFCAKGTPLAKNIENKSFQTVFVKKPRKYCPLYSAKRIQRHLKKKDIKHIMIFDNLDMSLGFWIKVWSGCKVKFIYQQHMQLGISKRDIIHTIRYKMLDAWISPLHCLAEEVKQKTKIDKNKIQIIPLGVDVQKLQSSIKTKKESKAYFGINSDRLILGVLGRIDRLKKQHLLLDAALKLKEENCPIDILIVGEPTKNTTDTYFEEIKNFIFQHNMEKHVFIRSFTDEVGYFFGAIDFLVLTTEKETYGMVTIESMLYNVPVLASNSGGTVEILEEGEFGTLYQTGDSKDLAEKIKYVLTHKNKITEKTDKAFLLAESYYSHTLECKLINNLINHL